MDKAIANIKYSTKSSNYSFYIEESTLDLGETEIGEMNNVNKEPIYKENEKNFLDIVDKKYFIPLLGLPVVILFLVLGNKQFKKKEKDPKEHN